MKPKLPHRVTLAQVQAFAATQPIAGVFRITTDCGRSGESALWVSESGSLAFDRPVRPGCSCDVCSTIRVVYPEAE
jgi:hypothetical protein